MLNQPATSPDPAMPFGFLTRISNGAPSENYFYAIEVTPNAYGPVPHMAPLVDDVTIVYVPADGPEVLEEVELDD